LPSFQRRVKPFRQSSVLSIQTQKASHTMREQLQSRLAQLKAEYESGEQMLAELEQKQRTLRDTLLRISGAVQVLEEELGKAAEPAEAAAVDGTGMPQPAPS
jgi:chromosome segregation ATPase